MGAIVFISATVLFAGLINCSAATGLHCPEFVTIERGSLATVSCNFTNNEFAEVYWYKGNPALSSPILQWVDGQSGGSQFGKEDYNISDTGAMAIRNAKIKHEAMYTIFIYFNDDTSDSRAIVVNITITPWPPHPVTDVCIYREECSLVVNDTGIMTCSIIGARPLIAVKWSIESNKGISFVEHPRVFEKDPISDTWNTSIEITYLVSSCNQEAYIHCVAFNYVSLLELSKSSVRLSSAICQDDLPVSSEKSTVTPLILVSVSIVGIATIILAVCCFKRCKRKRRGLGEELTEVGNSEIPKKPEVTEEKVTKVVMDLRKKYMASCVFDPLKRSETINVADLYVGYHCTITNRNGDISYNSTDKLLQSNTIRNEKRILIKGKLSFGRAMFRKQLVQTWIQSNTNELILLFVTKQEVNKNEQLINLVDIENQEHLKKVIRAKQCLLLLDGLPDKRVVSRPEIDPNRSLLELPVSDVLRKLDASLDPEIQILHKTCNIVVISLQKGLQMNLEVEKIKEAKTRARIVGGKMVKKTGPKH